MFFQNPQRIVPNSPLSNHSKLSKRVRFLLIKHILWLLIRTEDRPSSIRFQNLVECFEHEIFQDFALEFQFDFEAVLLNLVPVVLAEGKFLFEHVDDLVLVLLVYSLKILLVVYDVFLVDDAASQTHRLV